jgi:hypothetical protein
MNMSWERPGLADREGPLTEWQAAAQTYRLDYRWPAFTLGRLVWLRTSQVEALDVPYPLGEHALNLFRSNGITPAVFTAPDLDGTRCVFLVNHRNPAQWASADRLPGLDVRHVWAGAMLDLPPSQSDHGPLTWLTPPTSPLPEFAVVADTIISAADSPQ